MYADHDDDQSFVFGTVQSSCEEENDKKMSRLVGLIFDYGGVMTVNPFGCIQQYGRVVFNDVLKNQPDATAVKLAYVAENLFFLVNKRDPSETPTANSETPANSSAWDDFETGRVDRTGFIQRFTFMARSFIRELSSEGMGTPATREALVDGYDVETVLCILERAPIRSSVIALLRFVRIECAQRGILVFMALLTNNWKSVSSPQHGELPSSARNNEMDCVIQSYLEGLRKPDPKLFALTARKVRALAKSEEIEFAFFDDLKRNVRGAQETNLFKLGAYKVSSETDVITGVASAFNRGGHHQLSRAILDHFQNTVSTLLDPPAPLTLNLLQTVPKPHQLSPNDLSKLKQYLEAKLPRYFDPQIVACDSPGPVTPPTWSNRYPSADWIIEYFKGGQSNPTFRITTPTGCYVLRKQPKGKLLKGAHDVRREFDLCVHLAKWNDQLLKSGDPKKIVPVPHCLIHCSDQDILGTEFYVMKFIGNVTIIRGAKHFAEVVRASNYDARSIMASAVNTLANLHNAPIPLVLQDRISRVVEAAAVDHPIMHVVNTWKAQHDRANERLRQSGKREFVLAPFVELTAHLTRYLRQQQKSRVRIPPLPSRAVLVHGDFKLDNMMFDLDQPSRGGELPRLVSLLDFELAQVGDPLTDIAYLALLRLIPAPFGVADLDSVENALPGLPTVEDLLNMYCAQTGALETLSHNERLATMKVYCAQSCHKLSGIVHGVACRQRVGNASDMTSASQMELMCEGLALIGLQLLEDVPELLQIGSKL